MMKQGDSVLARRTRVLVPALLLACLAAIIWYGLRPRTMAAPRAGGPDFRVARANLSDPLRIVVYGDMRFTDPNENQATNPKVRRWLVDRIAAEGRPL